MSIRKLFALWLTLALLYLVGFPALLVVSMPEHNWLPLLRRLLEILEERTGDAERFHWCQAEFEILKHPN